MGIIDCLAFDQIVPVTHSREARAHEPVSPSEPTLVSWDGWMGHAWMSHVRRGDAV